MVIDTDFGKILVKQIAGILARRCINYAHEGDRVPTGQRFGLIKFGSRVDLFLPPQTRVLVAEGDKVYGGLTPVALFPNGRSLHAE
jgi:phosphatidylserine decarboxylase